MLDPFSAAVTGALKASAAIGQGIRARQMMKEAERMRPSNNPLQRNRMRMLENVQQDDARARFGFDPSQLAMLDSRNRNAINTAIAQARSTGGSQGAQLNAIRNMAGAQAEADLAIAAANERQRMQNIAQARASDQALSDAEVDLLAFNENRYQQQLGRADNMRSAALGNLENLVGDASNLMPMVSEKIKKRKLERQYEEDYGGGGKKKGGVVGYSLGGVIGGEMMTDATMGGMTMGGDNTEIEAVTDEGDQTAVHGNEQVMSVEDTDAILQMISDGADPMAIGQKVIEVMASTIENSITDEGEPVQIEIGQLVIDAETTRQLQELMTDLAESEEAMIPMVLQEIGEVMSEAVTRYMTQDNGTQGS